MTELREQGQRLADMLVEVAGLDGRRGAVIDTVIGAQIHLLQPLVVIEALEVLAQRCAASPDTWSTSDAVVRHLVDHCTDGHRTEVEL